jgi:hypothetical protein
MKSQRGSVTALALAMLLASCGASALLGPDASQGIEGVALLGPQCPVQTQQDPCPDEPYQAWIDVRFPSGVLVTRTRSGEDGRFRVGLAPGLYVVDPESGSPFPISGQQSVEVEAGAYTQVVVSFDTGIR